jgi:dephospho-CoA kinase
MLRIGLTGGIGAGKSVASTRLAELGAVVIDYDALAKDVVAPGTVGLDAIVEEFGPQMLAANGSLDRSRLGQLVFADPQALIRLNAVVHPQVRRVAAERDAAAAMADARAVVVHDIPLLAESEDIERFHLVVVVDTPVEMRVRRLVEGRGLSGQDARARIAAQADDATRLAIADVTLDGSGEPVFLREQVDALWRRITQETAQEADA